MKRLIIMLVLALFVSSACADSLDALIAERDRLAAELAAVTAQISEARKTESPKGSLGKIKDLFPCEEIAIQVRTQCGKFSIEQEVTQDDLDKVTSLKASYSKNITSLDGIEYLRKLFVIDFVGCEHIEEIPEGLKNCTELYRLDIMSSDIKVIPDWLFDMNITELDITDCNIEVLPEAIGNMVSLKHLDISGNKLLKELPESIGNLYQLSSLDISRTGITSLPDSIYALKLDKLNMAGLPIK